MASPLRSFSSWLHDGRLPDDYLRSFVCLIPKVSHIVVPANFRPICLIESVIKLYSGMLLRRLRTSWSAPLCQLGSVKGSQSFDALWTAHALLAKESMSGKRSIWISIDVKQAFDTMSRTAIGKFLLHHGRGDLSTESLRLFELIISSKLHFHWREHDWETCPKQGVPQGSPFSAAVFSYILGHAVQS